MFADVTIVHNIYTPYLGTGKTAAELRACQWEVSPESKMCNIGSVAFSSWAQSHLDYIHCTKPPVMPMPQRCRPWTTPTSKFQCAKPPFPGRPSSWCPRHEGAGPSRLQCTITPQSVLNSGNSWFLGVLLTQKDCLLASWEVSKLISFRLPLGLNWHQFKVHCCLSPCLSMLIASARRRSAVALGPSQNQPKFSSELFHVVSVTWQ